MVSYKKSRKYENCAWKVLILVVVDNGLVHPVSLPNSVELTVLILVVVDNGLVLKDYENFS